MLKILPNLSQSPIQAMQFKNQRAKTPSLVQLSTVDTVSFKGVFRDDLTPKQKLARTRAIYEHAAKNGWAIPAYNINNLEQAKGVFKAADEEKSPLIVQASEGAVKYAGVNYLVALANTARKEVKSGAPIMLHLDHGHTFEACKSFIDAGGDSVMIDGSTKVDAKGSALKQPNGDPISTSLEENIEVTRKVVDYAHSKGVFVEAELGVLAGVEDNHDGGKTSLFTDPQEAKRFVKESGCDSLAISIGTKHGHVKFLPGQEPKLDFERLKEIKAAITELADETGNEYYRNFPLVLHGASSSPEDLIAKSNENVVISRNLFNKLVNMVTGNKSETLSSDDNAAIEKANQKVKGKGVPEEMYTQAAELGITKVNVDSDFRASVFAAVKGFIANNPTATDPRGYFGAARDSIVDIAIRKFRMLNSNNKAEGANEAATKAIQEN